MPAEPREIIRPATVSDIPELSRLFHQVFRIERPLEVWSWKYFRNPRGTASYVCEADGRIVAHCGGVPVRFRDFEREYSALQSVDFMSSPTYPGGIGAGGVFVRTAERFFRAYCGPATIPLVYGFPGERHRRLGEKLLGYHPIEPVAELRLEPAGSGLAPEPLRREHLPELSRLPIQFGAMRDERYLHWRYLEHPTYRYGLVRIRRALRLHALIAGLVRVEDDAVYLMEVAGNFSRSAVTSLVTALRRMGRPVIFWSSPHHPIVRMMRECGFSSTPRDHHLECRFFIQREVPRPGEMYYTLGDYDVH
jgi:hypothetical protein